MAEKERILTSEGWAEMVGNNWMINGEVVGKVVWKVTTASMDGLTFVQTFSTEAEAMEEAKKYDYGRFCTVTCGQDLKYSMERKFAKMAEAKKAKAKKTMKKIA